MGNVEMSYVTKMEPSGRSAIYDRLFSYKFPAMIIARGIQPHPEMLAMAKKHNITILCTKEATSNLVSSIITYLKAALAPRVTRHGVMVEVYGEGILRFCTFVVPLALCQYYPLLYLTGRVDVFGYALLPLLSGVFLIPCLLLWRLGIRHYKSTGS